MAFLFLLALLLVVNTAVVLAFAMGLVGYSQECECWSAGSLILRVTFMCDATGLSRDRRMLQYWMQNCGGLAFVATAAYSIRIINAKRKESGTAVHAAHRLRPPSSVSVQKDHDQTIQFFCSHHPLLTTPWPPQWYDFASQMYLSIMLTNTDRLRLL